MWLDFCNFCFAIFSSLLIFILRIVTKILTTCEIFNAYIYIYIYIYIPFAVTAVGSMGIEDKTCMVI